MININVPNASWSESLHILSGIQYEFTFRYNERDNRWRLDIRSLGVDVDLGVKIMENTNLLEFRDLPLFDHGVLYCIRIKDDGKLCTRDNLGIDLPYEILYMTNEEFAGILNG